MEMAIPVTMFMLHSDEQTAARPVPSRTKRSKPVAISGKRTFGSSHEISYNPSAESLGSSLAGLSQTSSDGYRTPTRRNPSWSESSGSPRSSSPASLPKEGFYAGAKFSESPSPKSVPMPPTRWLPKPVAQQQRQVMELELKKLLGIGN